MTGTFRPAHEKLLPDLSPREEVVLLARTLFREGYDDHLAGHITYRQADGTLLCNPWYLTWDEFRPEDVIRIDLDGHVLDGNWPAPLCIPLHLELHKHRDDVVVAVHNHPRWAPCGPTCNGFRPATTRVPHWAAEPSWWSTSTTARSSTLLPRSAR